MNVVFILNEFSLHNHIIEAYCRARPEDKISIVKVPLVLRGKSRTETASRILPKLSKRFIWNKFQEYLMVLCITLLPKILPKGAIFRRLRAIASKYKLPYHKSENVMSDVTLDFIRAQNPDLICTLFHQIIKDKLITIPRLGIINIHPGILPDFRGIQPYFWELVSEFGKAGATLHYIHDESIDTGAILAKVHYPTWKGMSVQLNYYLTSLSASYILPKTISALERDLLQPISQDQTKGDYYSWPDSQKIDLLYKNGYTVLKWRDLIDILTGKYDQFVPQGVQIFYKQ